jgi:hypothetical protein
MEDYGIDEIIQQDDYGLSQARNYCLTINNPKETDEQFYEYCKNLDHIQYFVFQRERGEKELTEHFQCYIEFEISKRFDTMKNYFPTAHIEKRNSTKEKARAYCTKEKTRIGKVYEYGCLAEERERTDFDEMQKDIENSISEYDFNKKYRGQTTRYPNFYQKNKSLFVQNKYSKIKRDIIVNYIYGSTGKGKTTFVTNKHGYENVYMVDDYKNPFDLYEYEDTILFDEFRSQVELYKLLRWIDIHPVRLPCRYNNKQACYTKVYFTSNLPLSSLYKNIQTDEPETYKAFLRRIHNVYNFDNPLQRQLLENEQPNPLSQMITQIELVPIKDDPNMPF